MKKYIIWNQRSLSHPTLKTRTMILLFRHFIVFKLNYLYIELDGDYNKLHAHFIVFKVHPVIYFIELHT